MGIFIIYIGVIRPLFHFDCINFRASLVIKIINFNEIKNMTHLVMLVIFHVNVITCQIFNLVHMYHIFVKNIHFFLDEKFQISHMVFKHGLNYLK
jgi:hypothetical protein